jgi:hypothetical protein
VARISPEWITSPEQGRLSSMTPTYIPWAGMFQDGVSSIPDETVIPPLLSRHCILYGNKEYHEEVRMTFG